MRIREKWRAEKKKALIQRGINEKQHPERVCNAERGGGSRSGRGRLLDELQEQERP